MATRVTAGGGAGGEARGRGGRWDWPASVQQESVDGDPPNRLCLAHALPTRSIGFSLTDVEESSAPVALPGP